MRIAIITEVFVPKIDGITNRLRHTIECLRKMGHEVLVIAPDKAVSEYAGARVARIPGVAFPPYPGVRVSAPDPRIVWELRRFRPDVVHAVGPACLGIWGVMAARAVGIPLVASYHTDFPRYAPRYGLGWVAGAIWPVLRWTHNAAQVNLCPSTFTRDELHSHGFENVGIWRGGVDTVRFDPRKRCDETRFELSGGSPDDPILLYAGRLSPEKNVDTLVAALDACPGARLALVGDGPDRERLEQLFAGRPVTFTGFLRGESLARAFASADVFVMPSTSETLGFVVLEAMSSGCPVVAARAGGIPDLVQHGENGLLYDPARPEELAGCLRELLDQPDHCRHFSQQARKAALAADWMHETEKLLDSYRKAIVINEQRGMLGRLQLSLLR